MGKATAGGVRGGSGAGSTLGIYIRSRLDFNKVGQRNLGTTRLYITDCSVLHGSQLDGSIESSTLSLNSVRSPDIKILLRPRHKGT